MKPLAWLREKLRLVFTGRDNQTLDLGRLSWAASYLAVVGHDGWLIYKGTPGSVRDLAIALAAVAAAHGAALGLKASTEPDGGSQ